MKWFRNYKQFQFKNLYLPEGRFVLLCKIYDIPTDVYYPQFLDKKGEDRLHSSTQDKGGEPLQIEN